ncbi:MAG: molybdopterin-binding protein [Anaerolineae bacterium]
MRVEIVSISTKLLMGDILDINTTYISRSLQRIKAQLICKVVVGDDMDMIYDAFQVALRRSDVVIAIGGLGDGPEDFTRLAAAKATDRALIPQAPGIENAHIIGGTDARVTGFLVETDNSVLICLPDRRREMGYLLENEALPYLRGILTESVQQDWVVLRTVGLMESGLKQKLKEIVQDARHRVTYDSFAGQTNIQLWVQADSTAQIEQELAEMQEVVLARLGDHVYGMGEDRLEDVVLQALHDSGHKLAVAECYTESALARTLAGVPHLNNEVLLLPAASWHELGVALQLADLDPDTELTRWCRAAANQLVKKRGVDLGLVVYKNVTQGGVQVIVTLASRLGVSVTQRSFGGHPENIDQWAVTLGLAHLRRWLLAHR